MWYGISIILRLYFYIFLDCLKRSQTHIIRKNPDLFFITYNRRIIIRGNPISIFFFTLFAIAQLRRGFSKLLEVFYEKGKSKILFRGDKEEQVVQLY